VPDLPKIPAPPFRPSATVYGRSGSPTVTIALPFSRVDVTADDAAPAAGEIATLVARLARAAAADPPDRAELTEVARAADELVARLGATDADAKGE